MQDKIDQKLNEVQNMLDLKRVYEARPNDIKPLLQHVRYLESQVEHDKLIRDSYCRQLDAANQRVDELENALAGVLFEFDGLIWPKSLSEKISSLVKAREFKP